jgi:hypothetical protein
VYFVVCTLAVKKKIRAGFDMSDRTIPLLGLLANFLTPPPKKKIVADLSAVWPNVNSWVDGRVVYSAVS